MIEQTTQEQIAGLETAVAQARSQEDPAVLSDALIELARVYMDSGNVPKALTQYEEGLALAQSAGDGVLEARFWGYKGICLTRLGNFHFAQIASTSRTTWLRRWITRP